MSAEFVVDQAMESIRIGEFVTDLSTAVVGGLHKAAGYLHGHGGDAEAGVMYKGGNDPIPPLAYDDDDVPAGNKQGKPMGDRFAVAREPVEPPAPAPAPTPPPAEGSGN